ncbi:MAG TPA: PQQ-dependent sugar dehydrogenase, partial [Candidatus Acidoferrales bacterium]|nr:PQQ-dependent sugar dehydrogenase [Candidatus Acidoferrales bacterium]
MHRIAAALILLAVGAPAAASTITVPTNFADSIVVTGFAQPRAFAFLPDGRALVLEQVTGKIRLVVGNHIASTDPVGSVSPTTSGAEEGAQGIAIDPGWPARPYVYVCYTGYPHVVYVVRFTASGQLSSPTGESMSLGSMLVLIGDHPDSDGEHHSGCLRFGPDGMLYVSFGDNDVWCSAQDSTSQCGQFERLRVDLLPTGTNGGVQVPRGLIIAPGNPLSSPDSNAKLVWAYGFRNPWSYNIDPQTGLIYSADVGDATEEELDEVHAGGMYGWPWREGNIVRGRNDCPEPGGQGNPANGFVAPIAAYLRDDNPHAISSPGMYRAPAGGAADWPSGYDASVFYVDFFVGDLYRIVKDSISGAWNPAPSVPGQSGAPWGSGFLYGADWRIGADGSFYWLQQSTTGGFTSTDGALHRLSYVGPPAGVAPGPAGALRLAAGPNPFGSATALSFVLPAAGPARLALYDLGGRRVQTLYDGAAPAGETRIEWNGRDAGGRRVAPGLYVARLEASGG